MKFLAFNIQTPASQIQPVQLANTLLKVAESCFWPTNEIQRSLDSEFTYRDSKVLIPQVEADLKFINWVHSSMSSNTNVEMVRYRQPGRPLKLHVESPGLLNSLRFVDDEIPKSPLDKFEI